MVKSVRSPLICHNSAVAWPTQIVWVWIHYQVVFEDWRPMILLVLVADPPKPTILLRSLVTNILPRTNGWHHYLTMNRKYRRAGAVPFVIFLQCRSLNLQRWSYYKLVLLQSALFEKPHFSVDQLQNKIRNICYALVNIFEKSYEFIKVYSGT